MIAKPISIKRTGGKSGGCASKAVELTSGDLRRVPELQTFSDGLPHFLGFLLRLAVRDDIIGVPLKSYADPHVRWCSYGP
jgi:hypothetical protein